MLAILKRAGVAAAALAAAGCTMVVDLTGKEKQYSGYYRQGFEASDFYPGDGSEGGPWWATFEEAEAAKLQKFAKGEGRGRQIVVWIDAVGEERGPVDFGIRPEFAKSIHFLRITRVKAATDAQFQAVVARAEKKL